MKEQNLKAIKYKIRIVADIEGAISENGRSLKEDTGIEPFLAWAAEEIADKLEGECDIVGVKKVELEEL